MLNIRFLLVALVASVGVSAFAQLDPFDAKYSHMELLQRKDLQHEIKLTEAQRATMNKFADQHRARVKKFTEDMHAAGRDKGQISQADQQKLIGFYSDLRRD